MKIRINIEKITISHPLDIYEIMQKVLKREHKVDKAKEHFWVLAMSQGNKILNIELVALGANNRVSSRPADVLAVPLQKQAAGVILVHNHPSGRLEPSEQDKDYTNLMIQACRLMRTPVLDHVIITEHSYLSFKQSGLLATLEENLKYVLPYELEKMFYEEMQAGIKEVEEKSKQEIAESLKKGEAKGMKKGMQQGRQEGEALGEEKGMRNREKEIARQMLAQGLDIKLICDMTGLSEAQVNEL